MIPKMNYWYATLVASDCTKIKKVVFSGEPIVELIKQGQVIVSQFKEDGVINILFSQTPLHGNDKLCSLDCPGIVEKH